jgi:hypothetical protein
MWLWGIETKIATIPKTIRASSAQNRPRGQVSPRDVTVGAQRGDERGGGSGRLPERRGIRARIVREHRPDRQAEQQAEPEQQPDGELLVAARGGDVEPEDASEGADEQSDSGAAGEIASEVGPEGGESDGRGDEAHDLAEDRSGVSSGERVAADGRRSRLRGHG